MVDRLAVAVGGSVGRGGGGCMWIVMVVAAARVGDARVEKLSVKIKSTITSAVLASRVRKISPCPLNAWRHSPSTIQPTVSGSAVEVTRRKEQGLPRCRAQQDRRCRPKAEAVANKHKKTLPRTKPASENA